MKLLKPSWEKQPEFPEPVWYLLYDDGFYVVQKSPGGDWSCGWHPDDSPCITDETFTYKDTWQEARKYCESLTCHIDK